jgi:hypothetical protein
MRQAMEKSAAIPASVVFHTARPAHEDMVPNARPRFLTWLAVF